jgi:hypothetical protein
MVRLVVRFLVPCGAVMVASDMLVANFMATNAQERFVAAAKSGGEI